LHGYQHLPDDLRQTASTDIWRTAGYLASDTAAYWFDRVNIITNTTTTAGPNYTSTYEELAQPIKYPEARALKMTQTLSTPLWMNFDTSVLA
jgi:hypothetical protein